MANPEQLKLIQAVITRLAGNSFALKGWAVTLVAGLAAVAKADGNDDIAWISCGVLVVFALLDAYYLALERAFRRLYEHQAAHGADDAWSLTVGREDIDVGAVVGALIRFAVWPFYLIAMVGSVLVALDVI